MNDILTLDDLARLLVIKHNITREDADSLLQNFLNVIEKGLLTDRYVRIKGLGTFKLIEENTDRGALSNRIVFVPDVTLKDAVNKPFAHFESVVLNDNVSFDDIDELELPDSTAAENETEDEDNGAADVCESSEENVAEEDVTEEGITVPSDDDTVIYYGGKVSDDPQTANGSELPETENPERHERRDAVSDVMPEYKPEPAFNNTKTNNIPWCLMILVLLIGLALGGIISWQIFGSRMGDILPAVNVPAVSVSGSHEVGNMPEKEAVILEDSIKETVSADADKVSDNASGKVEEEVVDKVIDKADIDSILQSAGSEKKDKKETAVKEDFYSEKLTYRITGTIESHKIEKGNTLARIAYKYYRNKKMWPYIVMHNKNVIKDPNNVPIGTVINIPKLEPVE